MSTYVGRKSVGSSIGGSDRRTGLFEADLLRVTVFGTPVSFEATSGGVEL